MTSWFSGTEWRIEDVAGVVHYSNKKDGDEMHLTVIRCGAGTRVRASRFTVEMVTCLACIALGPPP